MTLEELHNKLIRLEESFEFQDSTIDSLNKVIIDQQKQIDSLELEVGKLGQMLSSLTTDIGSNEPEPPPPHY